MELNEISNAEWMIMRVIWTLKKCTSHQIINVMQAKENWKASTVKTLLRRLGKKKFVKIQRVKNKNIYAPAISEQKAANVSTLHAFQNICPMHAGKALNQLVKKITLSRTDVQRLIKTLQTLQKSAPEHVKCNCLINTDEEANGHENE